MQVRHNPVKDLRRLHVFKSLDELNYIETLLRFLQKITIASSKNEQKKNFFWEFCIFSYKATIHTKPILYINQALTTQN